MKEQNKQKNSLKFKIKHFQFIVQGGKLIEQVA